MSSEATKRATVYIEDDLHRALKLKSLEVERTVSQLINDPIRGSLSEDAEDLAAFEERAKEKSIPFEEAVKKLKARGRI
ncbi:MAG: CopG family transcriptional regulator [Oligoflexia bacterium]|nr:CopG family transcriptional regulator [Oligoflexia bacterium]